MLTCVKKQTHLPQCICLSQRYFAKRGIPRGRRKRRREDKPGRPRKLNKPAPDTTGTRYLTATPWGPPRYPVPRVQETSVEFAQNLNSLAVITKGKLCCQNLATSHYTHTSKAALERLHDFADVIVSNVPFIHLYQFVLVEDILGYSRDMGSRNTIWIPTDFTVKELIHYLKEECIPDPKLLPLQRLDSYLNPFQVNNWKSMDRLASLDGSYTRARSFRTDASEYREVEPVELIKLREKARHKVLDGESYIQSNSFFKYWEVPSKYKNQKPRGDSNQVENYFVTEAEESPAFDDQDSDLQQIDQVEKKLNENLLQRKQWFIDRLDEHDAERLMVDFDGHESMNEYYKSTRKSKLVGSKHKQKGERETKN